MNDRNKRNDEQDPSKYGFLQTMRAIGWGMLGIRKGKGHKEDFSRMNPLYLLIAGLLATLVFVLVLIFVAGWYVDYLTT